MNLTLVFMASDIESGGERISSHFSKTSNILDGGRGEKDLNFKVYMLEIDKFETLFKNRYR